MTTRAIVNYPYAAEATPTLNPGDQIGMYMPPPLTLWDRVLWRTFRIERKRQPVWQLLSVVATSDGEDQKR